jgi:hypothetical protein
MSREPEATNTGAIGSYMRGAYVDTNEPMYLIRRDGPGENIVRNGDLIAHLIGGLVVQPDGPCWISEERLAALTTAERKALLAAGVTDLRAIPVTVVGENAIQMEDAA